MPEWIRVASVDDCREGSTLGVEANGTHLVLAHVDGSFYALEDRCSHQDYPLSDGELNGERLECIYHGAVFDVCSGKALQLPAIKAVKSYDVEVREDDVYVALE